MGPMADQLNDDERRTVRDAALGALSLVSRADPGFFALFKESRAGSEALKAAPPALQDLMKAPGLPMPPSGSSAQEVEAKILDGIGAAVGVLTAKAPEQVEPFRQVVLAGCDAVANASKGVAPEEAATIDRVRAALSSEPTAPAPPGGPTAPSEPGDGTPQPPPA